MRARHSERGASMVEFAIAGSLMLFIVFGIIEFGRALYTYHSVANAARIGARWAMVRGSSCSLLDHCGATSADVQTYVRSVVPMIDSGNLTVTTTWSTAKASSSNTSCSSASPSTVNTPGNLVCVTVSYPWNFAISYVSTTGLTLSSTAKQVISN